MSAGAKLIGIVARADDGTIGDKGDMPWHLPADLRRFKQLTMGLPMIMGRKTFDSLPGMLEGRRHVVLTRDEEWQAEDAERVGSVAEALAALHAPRGAVIGGAEIFAQFADRLDRIELTEIHADYGGDTKIDYPSAPFVEIAREDHPAADGRPAYSFVTFERRAK